MNLFPKTNRNLLMHYRHDWQDPNTKAEGAVRLPTKSTPQHFPHIMRYRRGGQQSNINKCRRAQGQALSFDHFTIPRACLQTTQAVERGSHQLEPNITHMGCIVSVERDYNAWFGPSQTSGRCSDRL